MKKLETREQAEARAMELFPIYEEFDVDRLKPLREAYLQGWEDSQQDKQTCGFCVDPKQHQKELLKEMMRKDEESGMYDDLSDVINNVNTDSAINMGRTLSIADDNPIVYSDADASKTIKEAFENIPKEVKDRHAKAAYNEHKQLREAAEKVVKECIAYKEGHHNRPDDMYLILAIDDLEKSLR